LDTPENREVAGPDAWYFANQTQLAELLRAVTQLDNLELDRLRQLSRTRAAARYSWTAVGNAYLELLGVPPNGSRLDDLEPMPQA
jgi:hypothetical protein